MKTISLMPETTANITAQSAASSGDKNSEMQVDEPPVPQASGTPAESTEGGTRRMEVEMNAIAGIRHSRERERNNHTSVLIHDRLLASRADPVLG